MKNDKPKFDNKTPMLFGKTAVNININRVMIDRLLTEGFISNNYGYTIKLVDFKESGE